MYHRHKPKTRRRILTPLLPPPRSGSCVEGGGVHLLARRAAAPAPRSSSINHPKGAQREGGRKANVPFLGVGVGGALTRRRLEKSGGGWRAQEIKKRTHGWACAGESRDSITQIRIICKHYSVVRHISVWGPPGGSGSVQIDGQRQRVPQLDGRERRRGRRRGQQGSTRPSWYWPLIFSKTARILKLPHTRTSHWLEQKMRGRRSSVSARQTPAGKGATCKGSVHSAKNTEPAPVSKLNLGKREGRGGGKGWLHLESFF